jgi:hypothetical protein
MKTIHTALLLILFSPAVASAAQIFGTLKEGDRPVGKGVSVAIECQGGGDSKDTDAYGSYNLFARQPGKCTLKVLYGGQWSKPFPIYSYNDPVRYDFELVRQGDGQYALVRR